MTEKTSNPPEKSAKAKNGKRRKFSIFRFLFKTTAILLLLIIGLVAFLIYRPTTIHLNFIADSIGKQVSSALGRKVSIDGDIVLVTGKVPSVSIEGVHIANPEGWEGEFASLGKLSTSVGLFELLKREILVDDIVVEDLEVALARNTEDEANWDGLAEPSDEAEEIAEDAESIGLKFIELGHLRVENINVTYREGTAPVETFFALKMLEGSAKTDSGVDFEMEGELLTLPYSGNLKAGTLDELRARASAWPITLTANLGETTFELNGHFPGKEPTEGSDNIRFAFNIPRLEELVPLTGDLPDFGSVHFEGQAKRESRGKFKIPALKGNIGESPLSGDIALDLLGKVPRVDGSLSVDFIDLAIFADDAAEPTEVAESGAKTDQPASEDTKVASAGKPEPISILPVVGEIEMKLGEIRGAENGAEVADLYFNIGIEQEKASADVGLKFADAPLEGHLEMLRKPGEPVSFDLNLTGKDAELSDLIAFYAGTEDFKGHFEEISMKVSGSGPSFAEAWGERDAQIEISKAEVVYKGGKEEKQFLVENGTMARSGKNPATVDLKGVVGSAPFAIDFLLDARLRDTQGSSQVAKLKGTLADIEFEFGSETEKGSGLEGGEVAFSLKGKSLAALDTIYELNLPPLGPYSASGALNLNKGVIALRDVNMTIGQSNLVASGQIDTQADRPVAKLDVNAQTIQLNDFIFDDWSPVESKAANTESDAPAREKETEGGKQTSGEMKSLLSYESLNQFDATVNIKIGTVLSGRDKLGNGNITASLKNSRFSVEPINLAIPGGGFEGSLLFHPKSDGTLDWHTKLSAEKFELGVIARRKKPDTDFSALVNFNVDVGAKGISFAAPELKAATGKLDLDVCPKNFKAGILDLWATNIVFALLPALDSENESEINCILARLQLVNGVIVPETLGMDVTKIRVSAEGSIDLAGNKIDLTLTPYPKRPQLLSLELPIGIAGTLNEPKIAIGKLPFARTAARMTKNTILFPAKLLVKERLPANGSDVCPCGMPKEEDD